MTAFNEQLYRLRRGSRTTATTTSRGHEVDYTVDYAFKPFLHPHYVMLVVIMISIVALTFVFMMMLRIAMTTGRDRTGQGRTGQGRTGQGRTGQG